MATLLYVYRLTRFSEGFEELDGEDGFIIIEIWLPPLSRRLTSAALAY
jgi:hypothetical protein